MEIQAKKKFGQNFISDENLINKIIATLGNNQDQLIIEIGPGTGALTKKLVEKFSKVIAIEIDSDMEPILKNKIQNDNFIFFLSDVLEVDFEELIKSYRTSPQQKVSIISNMPYYITSEILFKTFKLHSYLEKAVFMMQKEVAVRVCANKGENNYNNLSIAAEFFADKKYEFTVSKGMFRPIPKVDSAIISLTFKNEKNDLVKDNEKFIAFVRKLFNNKRKTILNNLSMLTNDKEQANKLLDEVMLNKNLRPEAIGIDDFIKLYNAYSK
ncbi:16S rRNA (adenine(1518)-N(6)/adenine(1519)-N(6))-dimethyltransferase RsmA [Mesoplasma syrphidae]|uniref:Ribosomal RNA small subunit methyltransferase A n=1 Tax=Mesoplasma syrphidae TaxID=225999 RepID=A0A2K9BXV1_9MOLU|nr:16S rRNA (adenine(1518)-N(6)/adenine(1519)-N(6))-dimethyltransferase RsmA [Mesoplasma syrphidae]AUF83198.1 16S rRNA (adenine(1518)-N(6)/adenine(1519)-N(6))-dimethyltransferase RsmA [Mesoplasma syrphidae]